MTWDPWLVLLRGLEIDLNMTGGLSNIENQVLTMILGSIGSTNIRVNWKAKINDERSSTALVSKYMWLELFRIVFGLYN
jgi:hypothetical protein